MARDAGKPMYVQVADDLRRKIERGDLPIGKPLLSASKLMVEYNVSSTVIKNAMRSLRDSGHVTSQQGKAVFAALPTGPTWLAELIDAGNRLAALVAAASDSDNAAEVEAWDRALRAVPENQQRRPEPRLTSKLDGESGALSVPAVRDDVDEAGALRLPPET